jgi:predicted nucleotidyltransferase
VTARIAAKYPPEAQALKQTVDALVEEFQPERIYLFGSQARGDTTPDSDHDVMVVVPDSNEPSYRRSQRAYSAKPYLGLAMDVLVWTTDEFNCRTHLKASLPATILREGRLLHPE